ncbi:MAG: hypothetical protein H6862_06325 [Rhodospirillales bacterium]|nr:hypothetical protein [Rhodospirillales bacterium]
MGPSAFRQNAQDMGDPRKRDPKPDRPASDADQGQILHRTMTVDGVTRTYDIYVPNSVADKIGKEGLDNTPVIYGFHGTGGNSNSTVQGNINLAKVANETGSILIAPQALGQNDPSSSQDPKTNPSHWHVEGQGQKGPPVDDVKFIKGIQMDAENALYGEFGGGQPREDFGKIDDIKLVGMSNGSVLAADIAANPKTYLRDGTTVSGGAFVTATQEVDLHEGNAPTHIAGEQLFTFGMKDAEATGRLFQSDPNAENDWMDSANLSRKERREYDNLETNDDKAQFALEHQGKADPETGRTVLEGMLYNDYRQRVVSAAAAQGVMISDQDFDAAMQKTEWGTSGHIKATSDDGTHSVDMRIDMVQNMGHESPNKKADVDRTGYDANDRMAGSMSGTLDIGEPPPDGGLRLADPDAKTDIQTAATRTLNLSSPGLG